MTAREKGRRRIKDGQILAASNHPAQSPRCIVVEDGRICGKPTHAKSMCSAHHRRWLRNPTLVRVRAPAGWRTLCIHPGGCQRPRGHPDGWCAMHGYRVDKTGDPGPAGHILPREPVACSHPDGCPREAARRGLCTMHYHRWLTTGDLGPVGPLRTVGPQSPTCIEEEDGVVCGLPTRAKSLCPKHYARQRRAQAR